MQEGRLDPGLCWSTDSLCQQRDQALLFQCSHRPDSAIFNYFSLRKHLIEAISRPYFYYSNEIRGTNHTAEADLEPPFSPFAQEQNENKDVKNGAPAFRKTRFLANLRWRSVGGVAVQSQPALAVRCSVNRAGCRRDPRRGREREPHAHDRFPNSLTKLKREKSFQSYHLDESPACSIFGRFWRQVK